MDEESSSNTTNARSKMYKLNGRDQMALRDKRRESEIELRKNKREEKFLRNRQIPKETMSQGVVPQTLAEVMIALDNVKLPELQKALDTVAEMVETRKWDNSTLSGVDFLTKMADVYCNKALNPDIRLKISQLFLRIAGLNSITNDTNDFTCIYGLISNLAKSKDQEPVLYDTIQALACFISRSICYRNTCLDCAIVPELLDLMKIQGSMRLHRFVMWITTLFCEKLDKFSPDVMEIAGLLDIVAAGVQSADSMIQTDATAACVYLAEWPPILDFMKESRLCSLLVANLRNNCGNARPTVQWGISMIIQTTNYFTEEMIQAGLLEVLRTFVNVNFMAQEVCFLVSNICVEGEHNIERLIRSGVLLGVARVMENSEYRARREAAFVFCHCCESKNPQHIAKIVEMGVLSAFSDMLTVMDANLVSYILDALSNLLQYGEQNLTSKGLNPVAEKLEEVGCMRKLDFLVASQCIDIHSKSFTLLDRYFETGDELPEPSTDNSSGSEDHFLDVFTSVLTSKLRPPSGNVETKTPTTPVYQF